MGKLDNKVVLVTGGGGDIGQAIILTFARAGANIVVCDIDLSRAERVAEEAKALGVAALPVQCDVTKLNQVDGMVKQGIARFGKIDILVNNAGIIRRDLIVDMSEADWDDVLDTNLKSVFLCTKVVGRQMMEQRSGKIINMASSSGLGGITPRIANYCVSKAGVVQLTKCAARELAPYGIVVNAIAPGQLTAGLPTTNRTAAEMAQREEMAKQHTMLGRLGTKEEVAKLALFLASDDCSFVCGETILMDGGRIDNM